jgi:hypothetical protein
MKNNIKYNIFSIIVLVGIIFSVSIASASVVYVTSDSDGMSAGDIISVEVHINTEDETVNVVEGEIVIDGNAKLIEVRELSVSGSIINFWSNRPSLSPDGNVISFVGGVPGGVKSNNGLIFKAFFLAKSEGDISFVPRNIKTYKNDGRGTEVKQTVSKLDIKILPSDPNGVSKDEWNKIVASDNMPPEFLSANVGSDLSLFENKLFLTINGTDYQSGINYFEVKEGDFPSVRSGNLYVLRDQSQSSVIIINAYDYAGNMRSLIIGPSAGTEYDKKILYSVISILFLMIISLIFYIIRKKRVNNNSLPNERG